MCFCNWRWGRYQRTLSYVTLTVIWLGHRGLLKLGFQGGHKLAASQALGPSLRGSAHFFLQPYYSSVHLKFWKIKKKMLEIQLDFLFSVYYTRRQTKAKKNCSLNFFVVVAVIKWKQLMKLVFRKVESSFGIYQGAKTTLAFSLLWSVCYRLPLLVMQITPLHYLL